MPFATVDIRRHYEEEMERHRGNVVQRLLADMKGAFHVIRRALKPRRRRKPQAGQLAFDWDEGCQA